MNYFSFVYKMIISKKLFFLILFTLLSIKIVFAQSDSLKKALENQLNMTMFDGGMQLDLIQKREIQLDSLVLIHPQLNSIISKLTSFNRKINYSKSIKLDLFLVRFF